MRITHGMLQRSLLSDLNEASARLQRTQQQMTSGLQRNAPSDDPAAAARSMRLTSTLAGTQQLQANVSDAQTWTDATETALGSMTDVIARARELLIQGGGDAASQNSRDSIATEVSQLAEALKDQANASVAGRYLFSGTATTAPPYSAATGDAYQGDGGTVAREIGVGASVAVNLRASDVLGSGSGDGKLLQVLRDIATHLTAGNGPALRSTDIAALDAAQDTLLSARAVNGALTRRLDSTAGQLIAFEEQTTNALGLVDAADYAQLAVDFSTRSAAYQAALKSGSAIVQSSLMDFLN